MTRAVAFAAIIVAVLLAGAYGLIRGSLPALDGELVMPGLAGPVVVERDDLGIPTIRGTNRVDVARATGFIHAQDRFFQMDLSRRIAAGELSALVGSAALALDRTNRRHRFRAVAKQVLQAGTVAQRALLAAYVEGVNVGLDALTVRPFEYLVLRARPQRWRMEDTVLVVFAMYFQLHGEALERALKLDALRGALPRDVFDFIVPFGTQWDTPLVGAPRATPAIPPPSVCDLRAPSASSNPLGSSIHRVSMQATAPVPGSNNWALAGRRTESGRGLVANDMHLHLRLPGTWYRLRLLVGRSSRDPPRADVIGLSLPGTPAVVVGSNRHIAWGFTNAQGDWVDLVRLELDPSDAQRYRARHGFRYLETHLEIIEVANGDPVPLPVPWTEWGPVIGTHPDAPPLALRWLAHLPEATNFELLSLERAADVPEALTIAQSSGIPPQNFVVADESGRIGWTIMGRLPVRSGFDARFSSHWTPPGTGWSGWLPTHRYPTVLDPGSGQIWTANARVVEGRDLDKIGDGDYLLGARARQIRDRLRVLDRASERDMLAIQLDDRALLLERWQGLLLGAMSPQSGLTPRREEALRLVRQWGGRAAATSVGYRLVRRFRDHVYARMLVALVQGCAPGVRRDAVPPLYRFEGPLWRLVSERPYHLLPIAFETWTDLFLTSFDAAIDECPQGALAGCTWGDWNRVTIRHPLTRSLPFLSRWLDVAPRGMSGDTHVPRAQHREHGASQRFAVSPGLEEQGYLHMPGGQSGHPLSPHYRSGHEAWVNGEPTPFLPGPVRHRLVLHPRV